MVNGIRKTMEDAGDKLEDEEKNGYRSPRLSKLKRLLKLTTVDAINEKSSGIDGV